MDFLQHLSELVGLPIPGVYVALLRNYPDTLRHAVRAEDGSADEGTVATCELLADASDVLDINREARACAVLAPSGEEFFWPDHVIVIGETGTGDYYCIDASGEHPGVLLFEHLAIEFAQVAEALDEFIELLIENFTE